MKVDERKHRSRQGNVDLSHNTTPSEKRNEGRKHNFILNQIRFLNVGVPDALRIPVWALTSLGRPSQISASMHLLRTFEVDRRKNRRSSAGHGLRSARALITSQVQRAHVPRPLPSQGSSGSSQPNLARTGSTPHGSHEHKERRLGVTRCGTRAQHIHPWLGVGQVGGTWGWIATPKLKAFQRSLPQLDGADAATGTAQKA